MRPTRIRDKEMKKLLFLILLGIFVSSCDSSQKKLEKLLVELKTENPEEMEIHKKITEEIKKEGEGCYFQDSTSTIGDDVILKGYIGDTNEVYVFQYYPTDESRFKGLAIVKYEEYDYWNFDSVAIKDVATEKINPETGYIVIGVRKEGKLEAIIKGYAHGTGGYISDNEFKGFIYTKDKEIPFAFFSEAMDH